MPARIGDLLRDLSGRGDELLAQLVADQIAIAADGTRLAAALARGEVAASTARQRAAEIEHAGDDGRARLVQRLRRSVTSPVDREDLFRLSRSVDDVLDAVRDFIREADLFGLTALPACPPVLDALARGLAGLAEAVLRLPRNPVEAAELALRAKKQGLRTEYQHALSRLLDQPLTADVLKATLLLHRLDAAGTHLAAAADALADGVMKRFQ
ncbi:hypothetical protein HDA40_006205 [Hamadaea flava]|uniref:DUF47 domain-containing protein n=1 Tax=Hamadaea flava TaxID=1742688 RepID=A0ABV8LTY2_9ACTN|nr:DUF47 family protein [Hamadaea flava]MCP2327698.1 hypothetical protein [Hamadaea flava]